MNITQFQEYLLQNEYSETMVHAYKEIVYTYTRNDIRVYIAQTYSDRTIYFIEIYSLTELQNFNGYEYSDYQPIYDTLKYIERDSKLNLIATI